ncbi:VID27 domain-containing protein [Aphelenchoides fujianensis]|nr:VID27 domain-containing protein [Aphelenchoides fujianensis]
MAAKNGEAAAIKGSRFPTKLLHSFECNQAAVRAVRFNVDGNYCITCGGDKTVALRTEAAAARFLDACGSCDNAMILAGGRDCQPTIFDVESGKMLKRWREHGGVINAVAFNEDSRVALSASQDATIRCFDVRTRSGAFQVIDEATDNVLCMDVSGHEIVSGSADGHVRLYDIREGRLFVDFVGESVTSVHLTDDGQCCLVSSMDGFVRLFDKTNGALLNDFNDHANQEYRIESTMLKSGDQLASGSEDGHLYVYDVISGKVLSKLDHNPTKFVHSLAAHPTRNDLLLSTAGRKVFVWTAEEED